MVFLNKQDLFKKSEEKCKEKEPYHIIEKWSYQIRQKAVFSGAFANKVI